MAFHRPQKVRMFHRLRTFLGSTLGKKVAMSITGLLLVLFLIAHLAGNLLFFKDQDRSAFDHYAQMLEENPLLPLAEIGLLVLFVVHLGLAFLTTRQNREARATRYRVSQALGKRTLGSSTMLITGILVLAFVVVHLLDFRFKERAPDGLGAMLERRLSEPIGAGIYLLGVIALGIHLSHAVRSALRTLGADHPRFNELLQRGALTLAGVLFLGFAAFPLVVVGSRLGSTLASSSADEGAPAAPADPGLAPLPVSADGQGH
jgi:succinate dehydrogenase / fumarate reductase cytochrome b subunit